MSREAGGWHVIAVSGEVDLNSSPELRKLLPDLLEALGGEMVVV